MSTRALETAPAAFPVAIDTIWSRMRHEAAGMAAEEPVLASFVNATILHHKSFCSALSYRLAEKLADEQMSAMLWREVATEAYAQEKAIVDAAIADLHAYYERDPACRDYVQPFLYFKGFHAIQSHRIAHWLWQNERRSLAQYLQSRMSELWTVDINPAAVVGKGLFLDHAHGIVIGETARVGDNVSMLHDVTLGGTGKEIHDRHPKVGNGVLISAGAKVLGNITIGDGAKIAAGSVVLEPVKEYCTVAGVPAKPVGACAGNAAADMDQKI